MQEKRQKKSPIKQKILLYLASKGVSSYEFYKESGVTRGILQQENGISEDNIARFLAYAPEVNIEWLLTGLGDMYKSSQQEKRQEKSSSGEISLQKAPEGSQDGIPLIPISAMAGVFKGEITVMDYECERYVVPAFKGADFLMRVQGDSMQPTYRPGDIVACQRVPLTDIFFQWGKAYVIDTDQGAIVKRIRPAHDDDHLLIVSDNADAYPPFTLHRSHLHGVALVRGLIRLE